MARRSTGLMPFAPSTFRSLESGLGASPPNLGLRPPRSVQLRANVDGRHQTRMPLDAVGRPQEPLPSFAASHEADVLLALAWREDRVEGQIDSMLAERAARA